MKLLIQLEIEYEEPKSMKDYRDLINKLKEDYEENLIIPQTIKIKFKSLGKVRISSVIQ